MPFEPYPDYLTIEQAAAYLDVPRGSIRRLLRQHGLGEFLRSSIGKQVLIKREDLDHLDLSQEQVRPGPRGSRRGAA